MYQAETKIDPTHVKMSMKRAAKVMRGGMKKRGGKSPKKY